LAHKKKVLTFSPTKPLSIGPAPFHRRIETGQEEEESSPSK
jgi:hypothetical protein